MSESWRISQSLRAGVADEEIGKCFSKKSFFSKPPSASMPFLADHIVSILDDQLIMVIDQTELSTTMMIITLTRISMIGRTSILQI